MAQRLRNILIIVFASVVLICTALLLFMPKTLASADSDTSDDPFVFNSGAAIDVDAFKKDQYRLMFKLNGVAASHSDLKTYPNDVYTKSTLWYGGNVRNEFGYKITVYRDNEPVADVTQEKALKSYYFVYQQPAKLDEMRLFVAEKEITYNTQESIELGYFEYGKETSEACSSEWIGKIKAQYYLKDADFKQYVLPAHSGFLSSSVPYVNIILNATSPTMQYKIKFEYLFFMCDYSGMFSTTYNNVKEFSCESDWRSVLEIIEKAEEQGELEDGLLNGDAEAVEKAEDLKTGVTLDNVAVNYLEPIEGTPFAKKAREIIEVPVVNNQIHLADVLSALGKDSISAFGAAIKSITRPNADSIEFTVTYYYSSWLRAITTDGNYVDYFSNMNLSFRDYYYQYVTDGVLPAYIYDYMYNGIINKYPKQLWEYQTVDKEDELFGLWGMAVLPQSYSINSLWAQCFDTKTEKGDQISMFSYQKTMTHAEYQNLLKTYEYGWLERAWATVGGILDGGTAEAYHYFFYAEPGTTVAWIDMTGQVKDEEDVKDNPNQGGIIGGEVGEIGSDLKEVGDGLFDGINNLISSAGKGIFGFSEYLGNTKLLIVVGIVALAGYFGFLYVKAKSGGRRR